MPTRVLEIDLSDGVEDLAGLAGYQRAYVAVRCHGRLMGIVTCAIRGGVLSAAELWKRVARDRELRGNISREAIAHRGLVPDASRPGGEPHTCSVVIPTRDRTLALRRCLDSLLRSEVLPGEIIVVDNVPSSDATARLAASYPVRYAREDRPGVSHARERGVREASADVILFCDDDVVVDRHWARRILRPFRDPSVGAVTGMVLPLELETEAQETFELSYGGYGRGSRERIFDGAHFPASRAGSVGTGGNMAFRRDLAQDLNLFDVALGGSGPVPGGEDVYALYRILTAGWRIVYTPDAIVWHSHPREREAMLSVLRGYGVSEMAFWLHCLVRHEDVGAARAAASYVGYRARQLLSSVRRNAGAIPSDLLLAEMEGFLAAPRAYVKSRQVERIAGSADAHNVAEGS